MKISNFKIKVLIALTIPFFFIRCSTHSYFTTETYVKDQIQEHNSFELSDIIMKKFYKGTTVSSKGEQIFGSIIEIIGVNYKGEKQLAIGWQEIEGNGEIFIKLNIHEVNKITQWITDAENKLKEYKSSSDYSELKLYEVDLRISPRMFLGVQTPDLSKPTIVYFWVDNYRTHKMVLIALKDILSSFLNEF